ncbi:PadR family transcriptional regulator [Nesterenkonia sp. PF2B19]|uniref:PadR family transcriptional regulator n=1 Tax=Nesterenkonia sp. PF2B19 TaxID=1881858 RepID=UPI0008721C68|nr:helix-turn-helix transcriptional regulator [Nesterenkonia sp. PF2B19]OSM42682.1 PadR family transcriptional regulator [Nesterenkonia sp. PF2B19]
MEDIGRITPATADVLRVFLEQLGEELWGLKVIQLTGRPAGSVYPILDKLESAGWVESQWDTDEQRRGPRRRLYVLAAEARTPARRYVAKAETRQQTLGRHSPRWGTA